jgi:hypothetical protein
MVVVISSLVKMARWRGSPGGAAPEAATLKRRSWDLSPFGCGDVLLPFHFHAS